ncbi:ATP-binding protein [Bifidobacterium parmae]|uniref:Rad50/SbcC-type AAA domain-containing protein n=1 Tax=Bifidobacterium parmae TaxID=361854 RepID=A0A2N5IZC1_9BIFI|nr:ATP-binding protein [Bifidobacterium parmae]PLS27304.1 hypothetical protein Uis4E_1700 [Bifidobacterium parmae]
MGSTFTITSITVGGHPERRDSTVSFRRGLNVICGPSNSGKSWVLHCIDYMFGSKAGDFSLTASDGYTHVIMTVDTGEGTLTLRRPIGIGHNDVTVDSSDSRVQSGTYKCGNASANSLPLSHVWLKLIGFDDPERFNIIRNKDYLGGALTWRIFAHALYADETSISKSEPILLPPQKTGDTAFKSALATLIAGRSFSDISCEEPPAMKRRNNNAVIAYLETRPEAIRSRMDFIDRTLDTGDSEPLREEFDALDGEIVGMQESLRKATADGRRIMSCLHEARDHIAEADMLRRRYEELASSYNARLQRFDFVVEGLELTDRYPRPMICPVCNQVLPDDEQTEIIHPSKEERDLLQAKLAGLMQTMDELDAERERYVKRERELVGRSKSVDDVIRRLLSRLDELKGKVDDHNAVISMRGERQRLEAELDEVRGEIERRKTMTFPKGDFDAFEHYPSDFWDVMSGILLDTLGACGFPRLKDARLSRELFDVVVNGKEKKREGKGYRSFVNTVLLLSLHDYFASAHATYDPGILMIDTPLLGLDDPQQDPELKEMRETIPAALYDYLASKNEVGQLFIVDNTKFMPDLDGLEGRCNIVRFTKRTNDGRYGFLLDATDDDFKDGSEEG